MNVVLTGIFYPMAILRYFERALRRRQDINLYTAGPWTGAWIPWNGGMHLPQKYAGQPDMAMPKGTLSCPAHVVEAVLPWVPDVWLQVDAGWHLATKPERGVSVIVGTDPHVLDYSPARQVADIFYSMQSVYALPGDRVLHYAYDPELHRPIDQAQDYDAALIGLQYEHRTKLVQRLRDRKYRVLYTTGLAFDEYVNGVCSAPIGLSWSSRLDLIARVFELLAMRRVAVVNRVPALGDIFVANEDLLVFSDEDGAVAACDRVRDDPILAERIAAAGHAAVKPHTYDARLDQILEGL